ncbi:MAG: DUF5702 domain-containing protein [Lachnospiraceae bacterium]|jgi:hypothetical protein
MRMRRPRIRTGPCLSGQVLVYTLLVMTVTISLIAGLMQAAVYSGARAEADMACRLASEAGFSGYHDSLFETYGILALKDNGHLEKKVRRMIQGNLQENKQVSLSSVNFDSITAMTDQGGLPIREEVTAYMKNGALSEAVQEALRNTESYQRAETDGKVMESVIDTQESVMELEEKQLELLPLIEGIKAGGGTIQRAGGMAVATGSPCVKTAVGETVSKAAVGVGSQAVFDAVSGWPDGYVCIPDMIEQMRRALFGDGTSPAEYTPGGADAVSYESLRQRTLRALSSGKDAADAAQKVLSEEKTLKDSFFEKLADAEELLDKSREYMDAELCDTAAETLQETKEAGNAKILIDTDKASDALETREAQLKEASELLETMSLPKDASEAADWAADAQKLKQICEKFSNSDLVFDYSGIDFGKKGSGTDGVETVLKAITGHQTELVLNGRQISSAGMDTSGRAGEMGASSDEVSSEAGSWYSKFTDDALYNEYLFLYFDSYTDTLEGESSHPKTELQYPVEYILFGEDTDRENLSHAVTRLMLIRQGLNFGYLILSPARRAEAMTLASEMTGFTGSLPIVKTTQMLILAAWSYAEALVDLRVLFDGKKISAVKNDANWQTSLEQMLTLQLPEGTEDPNGLGYEEFLRILFMSAPPLSKYYRTMGAMESGLIAAGEKDFRMSGYIYSFEGEAEFVWEPTGAVFTEPVSYEYG